MLFQQLRIKETILLCNPVLQNSVDDPPAGGVHVPLKRLHPSAANGVAAAVDRGSGDEAGLPRGNDHVREPFSGTQLGLQGARIEVPRCLDRDEIPARRQAIDGEGALGALELPPGSEEFPLPRRESVLPIEIETEAELLDRLFVEGSGNLPSERNRPLEMLPASAAGNP